MWGGLRVARFALLCVQNGPVYLLYMYINMVKIGSSSDRPCYRALVQRREIRCILMISEECDICIMFCTAVVITNKSADTVVTAIFKSWITLFGAPLFIQSVMYILHCPGLLPLVMHYRIIMDFLLTSRDGKQVLVRHSGSSRSCHLCSDQIFRSDHQIRSPDNKTKMMQYSVRHINTSFCSDRAKNRMHITDVDNDDDVEVDVDSSEDMVNVDNVDENFGGAGDVTENNEIRSTTDRISKEVLLIRWVITEKIKNMSKKRKESIWLNCYLRFYRQCDIIPWSMDVDIGIFIEDYNAKIITEFEKKGLQLTHKFGKWDDSFELSFKEDEIKLDIFFFYTEGATMWNGGTQARTGKKFKYGSQAKPRYSMRCYTCWISVLNVRVSQTCEIRNFGKSRQGVSPNHVQIFEINTVSHSLHVNDIQFFFKSLILMNET
ncbi:unnamed protein product, partial [Meganyctiphanes norvegica]